MRIVRESRNFRHCILLRCTGILHQDRVYDGGGLEPKFFPCQQFVKFVVVELCQVMKRFVENGRLCKVSKGVLSRIEIGICRGGRVGHALCGLRE